MLDNQFTLENHPPLNSDNVIVSSHIHQLNGVIGNLRSEKLDLTTQLRKQQLCIAQLENMVDQLSKQVHFCVAYSMEI